MNRKTVYLLRHAESVYNEHFALTGKDPIAFDASITTRGYAQVQSVAPIVAEIGFELVLTSPLSRALQTVKGLQLPPHIPVVVTNLLTEYLEASCDIGHPPQVLQQKFSEFSFFHLPEVWWYRPKEDYTHEDCMAHFKRERFVEPVPRLKERVQEFRFFFKGTTSL